MSHGVLGYIYPCSTACEWISILMDSESLNSFRMGWGWLLVHLPYGDAWRAQRRLYHQELSVKATQQRYPLHIQASHVLLDRLHATPERWQKHLIQYVLTFSFVFRWWLKCLQSYKLADGGHYLRIWRVGETRFIYKSVTGITWLVERGYCPWKVFGRFYPHL